MPQVTFISHAGQAHTVMAEIGSNLMRAATDNGVAGIDGDCGGNCACATCHVFVDAAWQDRVGPCSANEMDMLNFAPEFKDNSRLACQIIMTDALDGLVVAMPQEQH